MSLRIFSDLVFVHEFIELVYILASFIYLSCILISYGGNHFGNKNVRNFVQ